MASRNVLEQVTAKVTCESEIAADNAQDRERISEPDCVSQNKEFHTLRRWSLRLKPSSAFRKPGCSQNALVIHRRRSRRRGDFCSNTILFVLDPVYSAFQNEIRIQSICCFRPYSNGGCL